MASKIVFLPMLVDDVKTYSDFQMTRTLYFSVAADAPPSHLHLARNGDRLPCYLLGLAGSFTSPTEKRNCFCPVI